MEVGVCSEDTVKTAILYFSKSLRGVGKEPKGVGTGYKWNTKLFSG